MLHAIASIIFFTQVTGCTTPMSEVEANSPINRPSSHWRCLVGTYHAPTPDQVRFLLFTRKNTDGPEELKVNFRHDIKNPEVPLVDVSCICPSDNSSASYRRVNSDLNRAGFIESKYFDVNNPTKILIHGFSGAIKNKNIHEITTAYLNKSDFNVIVVGWGDLATPPCYDKAIKNGRFVGKFTAKLIDYLVLSGVRPYLIHVVGYSLGAHVAGFTGKHVTFGTLCRITGLDPALPRFRRNDTRDRLCRSDAEFVDVIHTNAGVFGIGSRVGHADFYPNGGRNQPGCQVSKVYCHHHRSAEYFLESIGSNQFVGTACPSWKEYLDNECAKGRKQVMGDPCVSNATGKYYLVTNASPPYAKG